MSVEDNIARERLKAHEDLCQMRQGQILKRLDRLEAILISVSATMIVALSGISFTLFSAIYPATR